MALVDYSDSDDSDADGFAAPKSTKSSKGTFQKVIDRTNTGKIRISLPQSDLQELKNEDEHLAKRAKIGGGGLSDFRSFLPPPKRTNQASGVLHGSTSVQQKTSVSSQVLSKTSSAPEFSQQLDTSLSSPEPHSEDYDVGHETGRNGGESIPAPAKDLDETNQKLGSEVKGVGKPLIFKPLSVTRNSRKKKQASSDLSAASSISTGALSISVTTNKAELPARNSKVSLFPMSSELSHYISSHRSADYQPMIYGKHVDERQDAELFIMDNGLTDVERIHSSQPAGPADLAPLSGAPSLHDIASDLNLTTADRRQLFGRQKGGVAPQAMKVINFNTDEEYRHNEELRTAGEQVIHNPVRAIAPGKHSLKQLVNAAASQKDALEESFAIGKSNRAEASSRYGW